jgi:hypothetical protein
MLICRVRVQEGKMSDTTEKLETVKRRELERTRHMKTLQDSIRELQAGLGDEPPRQETAALDRSLVRLCPAVTSVLPGQC